MKLSEEIQQKLICPATKSKLRKNGDYLESVVNPAIRYPLINGIPILINSNNSIFSIEDFTKNVNTTFELDESKLRTKCGSEIFCFRFSAFWWCVHIGSKNLSRCAFLVQAICKPLNIKLKPTRRPKT